MTEADQIVRNVKKELANRGRPHMTVGQSRQPSRPPQFRTGPATSDQPSAATKKVSLSGSDTTTSRRIGGARCSTLH
jgi:2'-5' RNA ligase